MAKKAQVSPHEQLRDVVQDLAKQFGENSVYRGFNSGALECEVIPTGVIPIDLALGVGGFPKGRMVEIFGPESSGKTTLALTITAAAQRHNGLALYIDAEHAIDPTWAKKIGVNLDDLYFSQPDSAEEAIGICERFISTNKFDVIVVDSVAALTPKEELEGDFEDRHMALQARLMGKALRRLKGAVRKSKTCLIFINQLRATMNTMPGASQESTPGGRALKFYASVRVDIRKIGTNRESDTKEATSSITRIKIVKNKVAPPFREAEFIITYERGISAEASLIDVGSKLKIIDKSGSWYSYNGNRIGQSFKAATEFLVQHTDIRDELNKIVSEKLLQQFDNSEPKPTEEQVLAETTDER